MKLSCKSSSLPCGCKVTLCHVVGGVAGQPAAELEVTRLCALHREQQGVFYGRRFLAQVPRLLTPVPLELDERLSESLWALVDPPAPSTNEAALSLEAPSKKSLTPIADSS